MGILNWLGIEQRDASHTDQFVTALLSYSKGGGALPVATAALEIAAGLVGRAFAACELSGLPRSVQALTPSLMALMGRGLIRRGEVVFAIRVAGGVRLLPAASHDVTGEADPAGWRYSLTLAGPSRSETVVSPGDGVVHLRYMADPERPWRGIGPLQAAQLAGRLSAESAAALADEAASPRGSFLPAPAAGDEADNELKADIKGAAGGLLLVESMADNWKAGDGPPPKDWEPRRFGFNAPVTLPTTMELASREVMAACGVPPALFSARDAGSAREAFRQFLHVTVSPLGRLVQAELRAKLDDPTIRLDWTELRAGDIAGRARAFGSLVQGGMTLPEAAAVTGLLAQDG